MKKADRIIEKSRHYGAYPSVLKFFKKILVVTIDITTKRCYSMLVRCNNNYYIKQKNDKQGGYDYDTD